MRCLWDSFLVCDFNFIKHHFLPVFMTRSDFYRLNNLVCRWKNKYKIQNFYRMRNTSLEKNTTSWITFSTIHYHNCPTLETTPWKERETYYYVLALCINNVFINIHMKYIIFFILQPKGSDLHDFGIWVQDT